MKRLILLYVTGFLLAANAQAQICTVTGGTSITWSGSGPNCVEGGTANGKTTLVIPAGVTVTFNDNADTWSGSNIEVYGRLRITAAQSTINSSILVKSGGVLDIQGKLSIGSASDPSCSYALVVGSGGTVTVAGTGSDRLTICGTEIMKGSGACNSCGGTNSGQCAYDGRPYCQPTGGFTGPTGYDDGGFDPTLPVKLLYFRASADESIVNLTWATVMEEDFYNFVVQRSADGVNFHDIGEVEGQGFNIHDIESRYAFTDEAPLLGRSYYRLKAVDLDDSYEYFEVRAVMVEGSRRMAVYPNPSSGEVIAFRTNFATDGSAQVILLDQLGVQIYSAAATGMENSIAFPERLHPGVYFLRFISEGYEETTRVIVRH